MERQKKTSYPLVVALSTISTFAPVGGVGFLVYAYVYGGSSPTADFSEQMKHPLVATALVILVVLFAQWVVFRPILKKMYQKAIQDNEYDEFGRSKKKSYENLTRAEREEMDAQKTAQMESLISTSVLKKIVKSGSSDPDKDLEELIGLAPVKQKITEMVARMKFDKQTESLDKKSQRMAYGKNGRHFVFYGSAGTGKTTCARIITGFLYKNGYIKENKCVEIDGNFLKAGEMSDTKTKLLIQQSYGGVLFIDEAYTIMDGGTYGQACIATLIKEMEDNRDKFTVILAGYKNDMKRLLDANEGFKSRIKEYLEFPDYNTEEMKQIFVAMAHAAKMAVSGEALEKFGVRVEKERKLSSFGNARTARNILDETLDRHALNWGQGNCIRVEGDVKYDNNANKFMICGCDVSTAVNKNVL